MNINLTGREPFLRADLAEIAGPAGSAPLQVPPGSGATHDET